MSDPVPVPPAICMSLYELVTRESVFYLMKKKLCRNMWYFEAWAVSDIVYKLSPDSEEKSVDFA
jgi:hypothetical protein